MKLKGFFLAALIAPALSIAEPKFHTLQGMVSSDGQCTFISTPSDRNMAKFSHTNDTDRVCRVMRRTAEYEVCFLSGVKHLRGIAGCAVEYEASAGGFLLELKANKDTDAFVSCSFMCKTAE